MAVTEELALGKGSMPFVGRPQAVCPDLAWPQTKFRLNSGCKISAAVAVHAAMQKGRSPLARLGFCDSQPFDGLL
ncbi:MAG: hypothetical protein PUD50_12525 [Eubacteriales bacterium]|nr:hypothetical protein [Eubacteriales bacterium]